MRFLTRPGWIFAYLCIVMENNPVMSRNRSVSFQNLMRYVNARIWDYVTLLINILTTTVFLNKWQIETFVLSQPLIIHDLLTSIVVNFFLIFLGRIDFVFFSPFSCLHCVSSGWNDCYTFHYLLHCWRDLLGFSYSITAKDLYDLNLQCEITYHIFPIYHKSI